MNIKINSLEDLEKLVLSPKISKLDKYRVFSQALKSYPITFIEVVSDENDILNGIDDNGNTLIPRMQKIIAELKNDPKAAFYSGMCVLMNGNENDPPPDALIDFRD